VTAGGALLAALAARVEAVEAERTARNARDLAIVRAWKAGVSVEELVAVTGLARARLYQIRKEAWPLA